MKKLFLVLLVFCASLALAQSQREILSQLQLQAQQQLDDLNNSINNLQTLVNEKDKNLLVSQQQLVILQKQFNSSLTSLADYSTKLTAYETQLHQLKKVILILVIILAAWIAIKIARIIIGLKWPILDKIIPRWIDVLI